MKLVSQQLDRLRRRSLLDVARDRYRWTIEQGLLRQRVYPALARRWEARLARENAARRQTLGATVAAGAEVLVVACVDAEGPHALGDNRTLEALHRSLDHVYSLPFRRGLADDDGRPLPVSWFVVDWVGGEHSHRELLLGHHRVFDIHRARIEQIRSAGVTDELHWHYHHLHRGRIDSMNRDWDDNPLYEEVLARKVLERGWFPSVYRAGDTWEDGACSRWLERYVPFDLTSRGPHRNVHYDWHGAPTSWTLYHPSDEDPRAVGPQRRWMGRSLDVEKGQLSEAEVEAAFLDASEGRPSYVSFYGHDFRDLTKWFTRGVETVRSVAARHPSVRVRHASATELFGRLSRSAAAPEAEVALSVRGREVTVRAQHHFGEPFLAARWGHHCVHVTRLRRVDAGTWAAAVDEPADELAVAVNDMGGRARIARWAASDVRAAAARMGGTTSGAPSGAPDDSQRRWSRDHE